MAMAGGIPNMESTCGFFHSIEKLARIRREGLDVAALPFCVERVKDQRGLAGSRHARHYYKLVQWDRKIEILEVVLPRATDQDGGGGDVGHSCNTFERICRYCGQDMSARIGHSIRALLHLLGRWVRIQSRALDVLYESIGSIFQGHPLTVALRLPAGCRLNATNCAISPI